MRGWANGPLALVLLGSASAACMPPAPTTPGARPTASSERVGGLTLTVLPRPTPGWAHAGLWIDAGSRDGAAAATAARVAAQRASAAAYVEPDGTELSLSCTADDVPACAKRLLEALGSRELRDGELDRATEWVVRRRRAALADDTRRADMLALESLLEDRAAGLSPLDISGSDPAPTPDEVEDFLEAHYGPARAHLVVSGDVDAQALRRAIASEEPKLPMASANRQERPRLQPRSAFGMLDGERTTTAAAALLEDMRSAEAARAHALATLAPDYASGASVSAFSVRGAALVLARVQEREHERERSEAWPAGVADLDYALSLALRETPRSTRKNAPTPAVALDGTPPEVVRRVGHRWTVGPETQPRSRHVGLGVISRRSNERALAAVAAARRRARRWLEPRWRGEVRGRAASVVLPNGARVRTATDPNHSRAAIALRWEGGSAGDTAGRHGEAALLAAAMEVGCRHMLERADRGLHVWSGTRPEAIEIVLEGPTDRWEELLSIGWRCTSTAPPTREQVELARMAVLAGLPANPIEVWAAQALSPRRPGAITPIGHGSAVASVTASTVADRWRRHLTGARTTVAAVGAIAAEAATLALAARAARLPKGSLGARLSEPEPSVADEVRTMPWNGTRPRVVAVWWVDEPEADVSALRLYGQAVATAAVERAGGEVERIAAGPAVGGCWLALSLLVPEDALDQVPLLMARVSREAATTALQRIGESAAAPRWPGAREMARALLAPPAQAPPSADATVALLADAQPRFVLGRAP